MNIKDNIKLVFENSLEVKGNSFGFPVSVSGEVVFNTAMTGYPESLTDPSYKGQILILTYPLIGNYGVPSYEFDNLLLKNFESDKIHIAGLVISDYSMDNSHWKSHKSLSAWLTENRIPAMYGVDTRMLTKIIREKGVMKGKIICENNIPEDFAEGNLVAQVSTNEKVVYGNGKYKIVVVDCGVKNNIIRRLLVRDTTVIRVPWDYDYTNDDYDGLFISNGPGDPKTCNPTVNNLSKAIKGDKPIFGICLGNQLLCLASGGDTYKLKYGHRSHNQPVIQNGTNKCYITSQNHGYACDVSTIGDDWSPYFTNLNDNSNEGLIHKSKMMFSTQFHPEASSGPTDTDFLFDKFIENVIKYKKN
ncbi:MAG: glutamine-hydrolyzing carbamoyl-phosphate synthase small subunit [Ignavibacteriae bacterium]|nr:glutamine-hydrolyzing carbamoyl-phosphate synthase small subunit [Ignavibacteriota bacterium]